VIGDLKYEKRDKTAYEEWKKQQLQAEEDVRSRAAAAARDAYKALQGQEPEPPGLDAAFRHEHARYWKARRQWANELAQNDPELFRHLVPCDPVVTVAPDVVLFECFSKDESSYGCLSVNRDAFRTGGDAGMGTTNVDYSLALYDHFQTLRSYRATRLQVDPTGFEVHVGGEADLREEKIDLPPSWLRGFGQLQAAMLLPAQSVTLPVETVYALLAHLKRHREKTGPRSIVFQLTPGRPPVLVLEPWGLTIPSTGPAYNGPKARDIKVWGRRRLFALARLLPLVERFEVRLLDSGLPSVWVAHLGEMRFTLALSGWTANDWTSGLSLEGLSGATRPDATAMRRILAYLEEIRIAPIDLIGRVVDAPRPVLSASLHELAKEGQVVYDFSLDRYRYRPALPQALTDDLLGPEPEELVESRKLQVRIDSTQRLDGGRRHYSASIGRTDLEAIFDADGVLKRAKCPCTHFRRSGLRVGPCRHLLALRRTLQEKNDLTGMGPAGNHLV
jgi:hypothetical protein